MTTEPTKPDNAATSFTDKPPEPAAPVVTDPAPPAPAVPEGAPTWPFKVDVAVLGLLLLLTFLLASFTAVNGDLWLNLAVGKRYSEGKFEFGVDPFSWATEASGGKPGVYWVNHSWLYCWILYGVYSLFGGPVLIIGKAILFTATIGLLARVGWNESNRWFILICLVMAALAASTQILLHPIVVSLLFLAVTMFVLDRVGMFSFKRDPSEPDRTKWLWYLPPMFALWANLDHWFILGPILLALCWGATYAANWFPNGNLVPGKLLGQVLGVSMLACVVNPHHVYVFQLPPELGYLLLAICDPLSIPLPDALVGGGRALKELARIEVGSTWTIPGASSFYLTEPSLGLNVAGMAVAPLLFLGILSFVLMAIVRQQPGAPTLHVGRFVPWLFFAILALALFRMIPFFALIAAPLTAMTLGEFLLWQQTSNSVSLERRDRGLHMARIASVPFLALLVYLAWPGWLNVTVGANEFAAQRRVAWNIRPDESMKRTAETLHELKQQGKCGNVFNGPDLGHYLPWFAPEVKYYLDSRFSLFPGQIGTFHKAREALLDPSKPVEDWQVLFNERKIDQVVLANLTRPQETRLPLIFKWWFEADRWRHRYADNRIAIFSWAGPKGPWPVGTALDDFNHQAFGDGARRLAENGAPAPQTLSFWTLYFDGVGQQPAAVGEVNTLGMYYQSKVQPKPPPLATISLLHFYIDLPWMQQIPLASLQYPVDLGPPALPILMVRAARQAVADNPLDATCHRAMLDASRMVRNQEDYWYIGPFPSAMRDQARKTQMIASAYHAVQAQPDNPELQDILASIYEQQGLFDLALEHRQLAFKGFETKVLSGKSPLKSQKDKEFALKDFYAKKVAPLEESVKSRLKSFKENVGPRSPLEKVIFARTGQFQEHGVRGVEKSELGLGKKALEMLFQIDVKSLKPDEQQIYVAFHFDLLLSMGNVDAVASGLKVENIRNVLPPAGYAHVQMLSAAGLGDYATLDEALAVLETDLQKRVPGGKDELKNKRDLYLKSIDLIPPLYAPTLSWSASPCKAPT